MTGLYVVNGVPFSDFPPGSNRPHDILLPVNPSDTYQLLVQSRVYYDPAVAGVNISLVVPEPSIMLLLGLGLIGALALAGIKKKSISNLAT
jgi:hypothetical protein